MFFGVLAISPDAMFVRMMRAEAGNTSDASLQITFWKYLILIPLQLSYSIWHAGGCRGLVHRLKAGPLHIIGGGLCQVGISMCLNLAYVTTIAARAHLFFALSPFWAVLLSRVFLKDHLPARTLVALVLAIASIFVVFIPLVAPSLGDRDATGGGSNGTNTTKPIIEASLAGDLLGLLSGASLGALIVVSASAKRRCPDAAMLTTIVLGSSLVVLFSLIWQAAASRPSMGNVTWRFLGLALADSICVCIVYVATVLAPRYASSAEVGLLNPLEAVFGPVFVYAAVGEAPSRWTLIGGALLIISLIGHEVWGFYHGKSAVSSPKQAAEIFRHDQKDLAPSSTI